MNLFALSRIAAAQSEAAIAAAEIVGLNSPEYYKLVDRLEAALCAPIYRYVDLIVEGYGHKEAMLKAGLSDTNR